MTETLPNFSQESIVALRREKVKQLYEQYRNGGMALRQVIYHIAGTIGTSDTTVRNDLKVLGII